VRALILAAGRGARLRPLTDDRPKCLVQLAGRALLDWQLDALRAAGIATIAIVVGWRHRHVRYAGVTRFVNRSWRRTDMIASLLAARAWLRIGPCIVAYGDVVYHPDIVRRLAAAPHDVAISYDRAWRALWRARFRRPEDDAESLQVVRGRVRAIGGRVTDVRAVDGQFMGLLRLTPQGLASLEAVAAASPRAGARLQTTQCLAALAASGVAVGAVPVRGRWCEVDSTTDLELYERRIAGGRGWQHDWRMRE
jgi:L-glutamine-phosphate cytidylyltransferase